MEELGLPHTHAASTGQPLSPQDPFLHTQTTLQTTYPLDTDEWQGQALHVHVQQAQEIFCPVKTTFRTKTKL